MIDSKRLFSLNCDVAEGCDIESSIIPFIHQANICCGAHAGGVREIRQTLQIIKDCLLNEHTISVGAHPGYPDRRHAGRARSYCSGSALEDSLYHQINQLKRESQAFAITLDYIKPHGGLHNDIADNPALFVSLCQFFAQFEMALMIFYKTATAHLYQAIADKHNIPLIWEVFCDRRYQQHGRLQDRQDCNAVYTMQETIVEQARDILFGGIIKDATGRCVTELEPSYRYSLCLHGDNPASVSAASTIAALLKVRNAHCP